VRPVLGNGRAHCWDIDHLPGCEAITVGETERVPAVPTTLRTVIDDVVGVGGHRKARTGCTALCATLAVCSRRRAPIALFGPTLTFCRKVTRGRLTRVPGVLAELPLQLDVLRPQLFDHPTLGGHELRQTGDLGDELLVGGQCAKARYVAHNGKSNNFPNKSRALPPRVRAGHAKVCKLFWPTASRAPEHLPRSWSCCAM
jgi:hypothetical protein